MLKMFLVAVEDDSGMERLRWQGFVWEDSAENAVKRVKNDKFFGDHVDILFAVEATPTAGMILDL